MRDIRSPDPVAARYPQVAACLVIGLGGIVLIGWICGIPVLKSFVPGLIEMKANTAVCFICAGASLWLQAEPSASPRRRWAGLGAASLAFMIGAASLAEWVFDVDLLIDQLLVAEPAGAIYTSAPGRMAPNTALNFMCDGLALVLLDWRWRRMRPAQLLIAVEILMALLALLVYVYGVGKIFGLLRFTPMAIHTAVGFLILSTGVLWSRSDCGPMTLVTSRTSGGGLVRSMLPAAVIIPLVLSGLCLAAIRSGTIDVPFAFAIFTVATTSLYSVLIWLNARAVHEADLIRQEHIGQARSHASELARINTDLQDVQRSKDLLTGMVIHDLRNPLSTCLAYLEVAETKQLTLDPLLAQYLAKARDSSLRLMEMINGIVDIIRMEDGKMPTQIGSTDVTTLIAGKVDQFRGAAVQAKLGLVHLRPSIPTRLSTDAVLLARVIDNLLMNAIKHTPAGGMVRIEESPASGRMTIRIIDTGEGIAPADQERLFQKYGRVIGQTMGRQYDTGLGLVFCRMAVDLLHGRITVESQLGSGSTFTIDLPDHPGQCPTPA